ncbi:MAG: hypothetical protein IKH57_15105 [Clostridia bacterium]|nr:hypothetical protein [Clostridia bacterium]
MNITILIIEVLIFAALFTVLVFVNYRGDKKYSAAAIHNYPPDIQEEYFKTHQRVDVSYHSKNVIFTKGLGILLFTVILTTCAYFAGAKTFWQGFAVAFGLMIWIGIYDTFFLDWVLFANMKCFRLPGTEHMDKAYHQKWFHLKGMLFPGVVFALIPAALVGWFVTMIA